MSDTIINNWSFNVPPLLLGDIEIGEVEAGKPVVVGNYAYVTCYTNGFKIIDISNLTNPVLVGSLSLPEHALGLDVVGNYAYVANGWTPGNGGFRVIDISVSTAPTVAGVLMLSDYAREVQVKEEYAYVSDTSGGLKIIDITNPTTPTLVSTFSPTGGAIFGGLSVLDNYVYIRSSVEGLKIIDVSNPAAPNLIESYFDLGGGRVFGNYGYFFTEGLMKIVDVSNPAELTVVGNIDTGSGADIEVAENYAFVRADGDGLKVIDVSNPAIPVLVGNFLNSTGAVLPPTFVGDYAYVTVIENGNGVLKIFQLQHQEGTCSAPLVGIDIFHGTKFDDIITGSDTIAAIYGEDGDDIIYVKNINTVVHGGSGTNTLSFEHCTEGVTVDISNESQFTNITIVKGSPHDDVIIAAVNTEKVYTGGGNDIIYLKSLDTCVIEEGNGTTTVSYEHYPSGLLVDLQEGTVHELQN